MAVVWVTGASSGLGQAIAQALQADGWQVVGGARRFGGEEPDGMLQLHLDVSDQESVSRFCKEAEERLGPPDALVNAAGILHLSPCEDLAPGELEAVLNTNFLGATRMIRAVLPGMRQRGKGRIVNISSVNGLLSTPFQAAYSASKHALEGYSEALLMEVMPHGIQVMLVEPGDHRGGQPQYRAKCEHLTPAYQAAYSRTCEVIERDEATGGMQADLGRKVARAMERKHMPARLQVVKLPERAAIWLHDLLPSRLFARLLGLYYGAGRR